MPNGEEIAGLLAGLLGGGGEMATSGGMPTDLAGLQAQASGLGLQQPTPVYPSMAAQAIFARVARPIGVDTSPGEVLTSTLLPSGQVYEADTCMVRLLT